MGIPLAQQRKLRVGQESDRPSAEGEHLYFTPDIRRLSAQLRTLCDTTLVGSTRQHRMADAIRQWQGHAVRAAVLCVASSMARNYRYP